MTETIQTLRAIIAESRGQLDELHRAVKQVYEDDLPKIGRSNRSALMVAGLLENYYTCLETLFIRIAQTFENYLSPARWHTDLLERMALSIEGVRIAAVSRENQSRLTELLKFRHFRRYYFELEYDWDRLAFLRKILDQAHPIVLRDLATLTSLSTRMMFVS
jgi:hypothetical protein